MSDSFTARVPVPTFTKTADGNLYMSRGDQPVKRWDGLASDFVDAGVPAPGTAVTVAASGTGSIVGTIYGYLRFLDADGRQSNLSPLSSSYNIAVSSGSTTAATNASPVQITTNAAHGLSTGASVKISGVRGNYGANGRWEITVVGTTTFTLDESEGTGDYTSGGEWSGVASTSTYTDVEVPTDSRVTTRQILRSKDGSVNVFYIDVTDTDLTDTSFSSTNTDDDLGAAEEVTLMDDNGNDFAVSVHGEPPGLKQVLISHYSRLWAAVDMTYTEGSVVLTNSSTTVTGIGTGWTSSMAGRVLYPNVSGNTKSYTISSVNTTNQTLTLSSEYDGTTSPFADYAIAPGGQSALRIFYSMVDYPDSWNKEEADGDYLTITEDPQAGDMTGLMPLSSSLFVLFEHRLYRLEYVTSPKDDGRVFLGTWRGCVNQKCWVTVEGNAYLLDRKGIYAYDGRQAQELASDLQPLFSGRGELAINWQNADNFHAAHYPSEQTIKWFVCLSGMRYPRHALCYHYIHARWWVEEYSRPVTSSTVGELNGSRQLYLGLDDRQVVAPNTGSLDGLGTTDGKISGTLGEATQVTASDASAQFNTAVIGTPIQITDGRGKGQQRVVVAASGERLTVDRPWLVRPDNTSKYQLGGIRWSWKSGMLRWVWTDSNDVRGFELVFQPDDGSRLSVRRYLDHSTEADLMQYDRAQSEGDGSATEKGSFDIVVDTTETTGVVEHFFDGVRQGRTKSPMYVRIEVEGVPSTDRQKVFEVSVHGVQQ